MPISSVLTAAESAPENAAEDVAQVLKAAKALKARATACTSAALRRMGADTTEVKLLMQNDFQNTVAKYQIVKSARLYRDELAIAALSYETNRILAAQAADELLSISGILTSFVLYPDGNQVVICARSIGTCNVQVVLEKLGGGGNAASAGAQIKNAQLPDVLEKLVASIDKFYG